MLSVPFICALYYQSCHFIVVLSFLPSFLLSFFFFMYSFSSLEITTLTLSASAIQLMQDHSLLDSDIATLETSIILFIPTFNSNLLIFIVNKQSLYWEAIFCPFFLFFFHQAYTLQLRNQRQALLGFVKFLLFRLTHKQDNSARRYVGGIFSKKSWLLFFLEDGQWRIWMTVHDQTASITRRLIISIDKCTNVNRDHWKRQ